MSLFSPLPVGESRLSRGGVTPDVAEAAANARAFARCARNSPEFEANPLAYDKRARVCGNWGRRDGDDGGM
ncbi:hypothetical protein CH285_00615, partial [Rhodococcus sp. 05-2256-B1]